VFYVQQTAYKGLLRLHELFTGIQEKTQSGYLFTQHHIIGLLEAVIGTIVFILPIAFMTVYFVNPPSALRNISQAIMLCVIIPGFEKIAVTMFLSKFQSTTGC
jgi:multisubunit Na+/H+ antiporter MnhG subunit